MKVVIVTPAAPHAFGDTAARWFFVLVDRLLRDGHVVDLIVVSNESARRIQETEAYFAEFSLRGQLRIRWFAEYSSRGWIARKVTSLFKPFSETALADGVMQALEESLARGYDILHLEQLWTGWLGQGRKRTLLNVQHFEIIDWEDRTNLSWSERKALYQMKRATRRILRGVRYVRATTSRLAERARTLEPDLRIWTVPFAIDPKQYQPQPFVDAPVFGVLGSMHWHPSRSAAERLITQIWPLVAEMIPDARLVIAGWNARRYLDHLCGSERIELYDNMPKPTDFFSRVAVMAYAPSRGSGFKVKVLESMAYGVPVVTTWEGVEGIDYENGKHCIVAESDEDIAAAIVSLLSNSDKRRAMRSAARALIEERYSPDPVVHELYRAYREIAAVGKAPSSA